MLRRVCVSEYLKQTVCANFPLVVPELFVMLGVAFQRFVNSAQGPTLVGNDLAVQIGMPIQKAVVVQVIEQ